MTARSSASRAISLSRAVTIRSSNSVADALDRGAAGRQLFLEPLEAAVQVIDAVDHGLAFSGQSRNHQRYRSAQVRRHHVRAPQFRDPVNGGGFAVEMNTGAEPRQFLHVHE